MRYFKTKSNFEAWKPHVIGFKALSFLDALLCSFSIKKSKDLSNERSLTI